MTPDRAAILAELQEFAPDPDLRDGEITSQDIMETYGVSWNRAIRWAGDMVDRGILECVGNRIDPRIKKQVKAWKRAEHKVRP
jgi:hypothetical protein